MTNITDDRVTKYLRKIYRPLSKELGELRKKAEEGRIPVILPETEMCILNLLRIKKPKRILEIGTAVGYSAACFATALPESLIISIESDPLLYDTATDNIKKLGLKERIKLVNCDARAYCGPNTIDEYFDVIFIDASKSHYSEFLNMALKYVRLQGLVISDNVLLKGASAHDDFASKRFKTNIRNMREYLCDITERNDMDTAVLSVGDGLAVTIVGSGKSG